VVAGLPDKSAPRPRPNAGFDMRAGCRRAAAKSILSGVNQTGKTATLSCQVPMRLEAG